ncbi:Major facilitator superfamily domain, general substrate transporter [Cordyceps fumosorosea ARSEF 2679]|uniref:Major facilitator superfamily domain, general substrate transporter n=1 Tax=Cordyceps fumosorosea (strain ARSEF 2679) TaxID=1081104 RepID=A0A167S9B9_CORFA|nr:Major facilitator superfamily domain, general substrate transporter [Cordyceps fumosorosea ARSEF 2679]OAA59390.1 Major facilitator superfamily domain, general substrate transporter [Cordyceps fumosorosea ARSEF 2679]
MATSTSTVELQPLSVPGRTKQIGPAPNDDAALRPDFFAGDGQRLVDECAAAPDNDAPAGAVSALQQWNNPSGNVFRLVACFWCFLVMGANDAAYGPLLQSLISYYDLTYTVVSLVFLSPFAGYVGSALLNNYLHLRVGQRGVAALGAASHIIAYVIIATHPPFVALIFAFMLAGFGNGINDAAWNAWVGNLDRSSELLGFLHAFYGVGGVISPFISTAMITKGGLPWYTFYYLMIGIAGVELVAMTVAFWKSTGAVYRAGHRESQRSHTGKETGLDEALFQKPAARISWVSALFLLCYVGVEVALGGWIVTFMSKVRKQDDFSSGMSAAGFWLGITFGRAILGFVSPRIGVKLAISIYIGCAAALELVFWLVPQFIVSAVAVSLQGFFLGPMFPGAVLVASKLLPKHLHVVVIGFAAAFGGCGAAILPFVTGLLVQGSGPTVLQPIILALLVVMLVVWLLLPRIDKKRD